MTDKKYVCAYGQKCLHHGEKVNSSESVVINKRHYHWDCATRKQEIKECVDLYMSYIEDKAQYPLAMRAINTLVFKYKIPIEFILRSIENSKTYYEDKPVHILYGLRKMFWEKEFGNVGGKSIAN